MNTRPIAGLGDKSHLRGNDVELPDYRRRRRCVLQVRGMDLLRFHLLLLHHLDDNRFRRHGRAAERQRAQQEARVRDVCPNIYSLRLGDRGGLA